MLGRRISNGIHIQKLTLQGIKDSNIGQGAASRGIGVFIIDSGSLSEVSFDSMSISGASGTLNFYNDSTIIKSYTSAVSSKQIITLAGVNTLKIEVRAENGSTWDGGATCTVTINNLIIK